MVHRVQLRIRWPIDIAGRDKYLKFSRDCWYREKLPTILENDINFNFNHLRDLSLKGWGNTYSFTMLLVQRDITHDPNVMCKCSTGRCHPWPNIFWMQHHPWPNIFWMQTIEFNVRVSNMFYSWSKILIEIRRSNNQNRKRIQLLKAMQYFSWLV